MVPAQPHIAPTPTLHIPYAGNTTGLSPAMNHHHPSAQQAPAALDPLEHRRKILSEVREHLDLLKEFEGIISDEDLAQRKRDLFRALPPAPPPAKRPRVDEQQPSTTSAEQQQQQQHPDDNSIIV